MPVAYDRDRVDEVLTRIAGQDDQLRQDAAYLREVIRELGDDPVLTLLTKSLDRQADAADKLAEAVVSGLGEVRKVVDEGTKEARDAESTRFKLTLLALVLIIVLFGAGALMVNARLNANLNTGDVGFDVTRRIESKAAVPKAAPTPAPPLPAGPTPEPQ